MGEPDDEHAAGLTLRLAEYLSEERRLNMQRANAAARAAGLPYVVSACARDHALGAVLRMLEREFPEVYRRALEVVERSAHKT